MDSADSFDVVDALLAIHGAINRLSSDTSPTTFMAIQPELEKIIEVCQRIVERRRSELSGATGGNLLSSGLITGGRK